MEFSGKWRVVGTLLAGAAIVLGAPGVWSDVQAWRNAQTTVPAAVPARYLVLAGFAILLLFWAPTIWKWLKGHRKKLARAAEAEGLEAKAAEAEQRATTLQREVDAVRELLIAARKERDEEKGWKELAEKHAFTLSCKADFGEDLPEYRLAATQSDIETMVSRLWEIQPSLDSLRSAADALWNEIVKRAQGGGDTTAVYWLASRMRFTEYANLYRIWGRVKEALDNKWDPRRYVARSYTCYCDWRASMLRLDAMTESSVSDTPAFIAWQAAERRYFDDLQSKLSLPQFREARSTVKVYDADVRGSPRLMPGLPE